MKFSSDIVVFDLEASCKEFNNNIISESNIIEIGAVKLDKKSLVIKDEFSILIKPKDYKILPEISKITKITPEMVADKLYFDKAIQEFFHWYGRKSKSILAGWGLYYDLPLLRKELRRFDLDYSTHFVGGGLDIKSLAYVWLAKNNHSTSNVNIERMVRKLAITGVFNFHRALDDARATALILQKLLKESASYSITNQQQGDKTKPLSTLDVKLSTDPNRILEKYEKRKIKFVKVKNGSICLGGRPSLKTIKLLGLEGVNHIITLQNERELKVPDLGKTIIEAGMTWKWFPLSASRLPIDVEFKQKIQSLYADLEKELKAGKKIFIHCAAGIHRTGCFTNGLLRYMNYEKEESRRLIEEMRKVTVRGAVAKHWNWSEKIII